MACSPCIRSRAKFLDDRNAAITIHTMANRIIRVSFLMNDFFAAKGFPNPIIRIVPHMIAAQSIATEQNSSNRTSVPVSGRRISAMMRDAMISKKILLIFFVLGDTEKNAGFEYLLFIMFTSLYGRIGIKRYHQRGSLLADDIGLDIQHKK